MPTLLWQVIRWLIVVTAAIVLAPFVLALFVMMAFFLPRGTWPIFWGRLLSDAVRFALWRK